MGWKLGEHHNSFSCTVRALEKFIHQTEVKTIWHLSIRRFIDEMLLKSYETLFVRTLRTLGSEQYKKKRREQKLLVETSNHC